MGETLPLAANFRKVNPFYSTHIAAEKFQNQGQAGPFLAMAESTDGDRGRVTLTASGGPKSWASVLGKSLAPSLNKNVLEVILEKDSRGGFSVTDSECSNLLRRLGLDQRPGVHIEEVQICPNGRGVIFITLKKNVEIARYCRHEVLDVTSSGTRAVHVKPAGRREVVVSIKGIHPNTREEVVLNYLEKFGKVISSKVIYSVYTEGPLKGLRNGDRNYKMEIKSGTLLGSYHVLDGQKVSLRYPGQQQTCARCLEPANKCRGNGVARKCEAIGGVKVDFSEYILKLWDTIGYSPSVVPSHDLDAEHDRDLVDQQDGGIFTPVKAEVDSNKFTGVSIRGIPKGTDEGEVIELLVKSGLNAANTENVTFSSNGSVTVRELANEECLAIIEALHSKKFFDKKVYCNGIIPLTPEKVTLEQSNQDQTPKDRLGYSSSSRPELREPLPPPKPAVDSPQERPGYSSPTRPEFREPLPPSMSAVASPQDKPRNSSSSRLELREPLPPPESAAAAPSGEIEKPLPLVEISEPHSSSQPNPGAGAPTSPSAVASYTSERWHSQLTDWASSDWTALSNDVVARRHSISLTNRTPPRNSLACELLGPQYPLLKSGKNSVMSSIKDLQDTLSDFNSCNSTMDSSSCEEASEEADVGKRKRKQKKVLGRDHFLKKQNTQVSPK